LCARASGTVGLILLPLPCSLISFK
jgi:hypothetical protein